MIWVKVHAGIDLGFLPGFFEEDDPRPAREQIDERYVSGWQPVPGCSLKDGNTLMFPGDPPYRLLAVSVLHDEELLFFTHDFLAIVNRTTGALEVGRVD